MRDYTGVPYHLIDDTVTRSSLARIDYFLRDLSRGVQRIQSGQIPDGSGTSIGSLGDDGTFFKLLGRSTDQLGYGSTHASGNLTLASTINPAKGFVYLGVDGTKQVAFDETNGFLGIGTGTPDALLHVHAADPGAPAIGSLGTELGELTTIISAAETEMLRFATFQNNAGAYDLAMVVGGSAASRRLHFTSFTQPTGIGMSFGTFGGDTTICGHLQCGSLTSGGAATNANLGICGINDTNGNSFRSLFTYHTFETGVGAYTNVTRVGINADPFDFSGSIANNQPDSLHVVRNGGGTGPTLLVEGATSTVEALSVRAASSGTKPNRTINNTATGTFMAIRHNGDIMLTDAGTQRSLVNASITGVTSSGVSMFRILGISENDVYFAVGNISAWSDGLSATASKFAQFGTLDTVSLVDHRAFLFASSQFGIFTRFGISSAYTLISNDQAAGAGFSAPDSPPTVLHLVNSVGNGNNGSVLAKFESKRSGQTADLFQIINTAGTPVSVNAAGKLTALTAYLGVGGTSGGQDITVAVAAGANPGGLYFDDNSGFVMQHVVTAALLTANRTITWPDASGTVVLAGVKVALSGNTNSVFDSNTASSGASFADLTVSTKKLRFVLSGAVGNNSLTLTNTAARNFGLGDVGGNIVIAGDQAPAVSAGRLGKVDLTGQTAGIGSTNLSNTPPAGIYKVDVVVVCTTASGAGAPTLDFNLAWTDVLGATNRNATANPGETAFPLPLSTTGRTAATYTIHVASGNIAYSTTVNAAAGTPQYALYIRTVALG